MNITGTATLLEVVWTLGAAQGAILSAGMVAFWRDKERLRRRRGLNGHMRKTIRTHVGRKCYYLASHLGFFTIGAMALSLPPRAPVNETATLVGPITALVLIGVMAGMQLDIVRAYRAYRQIADSPVHG